MGPSFSTALRQMSVKVPQEELQSMNAEMLRSYTTFVNLDRPQRVDQQQGSDYCFPSKAIFSCIVNLLRKSGKLFLN